MKEKFNNDIESLKKNEIEALKMTSSLSQIKNSLESISSRLNEMEGRISGSEEKK
jgi:hypothetical protein